MVDKRDERRLYGCSLSAGRLAGRLRNAKLKYQCCPSSMQNRRPKKEMETARKAVSNNGNKILNKLGKVDC
jgi:hypothetical protein